jgi:hypothetical protein
MNFLKAALIIVVCAGAIAWIGNAVVSQVDSASPGRSERAMASAHDESHHHHRHGNGADRGLSELLGSTLVFSGVAAAVIIPSVIIQRQKRLR